MPTDLQFTTANIEAYQPIPSDLYPTTSAFVSNVSVLYNSASVTDNILPSGNNVSISWQYPTSDNLFVQVAVGYQLQILQGSYSPAQLQAFQAPGLVVFEQDVSFNAPPTPYYISLTSGAVGQLDVPSGILLGNNDYTVRVRALVWSQFGAGTVENQFFKYTSWGVSEFTVNNVPNAINLRVNGQVGPLRLPQDSVVTFGFTFNDTDGPSCLYQVQVGTTPGPGFSANIWDSGLINAGKSLGPQDVQVQYGGPSLAPGVTYAWRVNVQDGLSNGGWTSANDVFALNQKPVISSLKVNGNEIAYGAIPTVADSGVVLSWTYSDPQKDAQQAYNVTVATTAAANRSVLLATGNIFSSASSLTLPPMEDNVSYSVTVAARDSVEFSNPVTGNFAVDAAPTVANVTINGMVNPGNVPVNTTPTFGWTFLDKNAGKVQAAYQIQVAVDPEFASVIWDSGSVASSSNSVPYGGTPLLHSQYFVQVRVSDGISYSPYANGFFAMNTRPGSPILLPKPPMGDLFWQWLPASPLDADGDAVTYTLEITSTRSSNIGWEFLAGPLNSAINHWPIDFRSIPAGNDYGIRILANDGFMDSDPSQGSTSPVGANGLGFTVAAQPPVSPTIIYPTVGMDVSTTLIAEWIEASPASIDGSKVSYVLELCTNTTVSLPVYNSVGVYNQGTTKAFVDVSDYADSSNCKLRITASDMNGLSGVTTYSAAFSIVNTPIATDFERMGATLYVGTSDGKVYRASESFWDVDNDFSGVQPQAPFQVFSNGNPVVVSSPGSLSIQSPPGATYMLRITNENQTT